MRRQVRNTKYEDAVRGRCWIMERGVGFAVCRIAVWLNPVGLKRHRGYCAFRLWDARQALRRDVERMRETAPDNWRDGGATPPRGAVN